MNCLTDKQLIIVLKKLLILLLLRMYISRCYLTRRHSRSASTDHGVSDSVLTPVLSALSRAEQRQSSLLEVAGACWKQIRSGDKTSCAVYLAVYLH